MIHYMKLGKTPPKPHTAFYDEGKLLMEHCHTREGFEGAFSILYYRTPPTDENAVERVAIPGFCPFEPLTEQPLHRRHIKTQDLALKGDFLDARRVMLFNSDVQISMARPTETSARFFANGDGDELYFVHKGSGRIESLFGVLPFRERDYVLIPRSTPYRIHWGDDGAPGSAGVSPASKSGSADVSPASKSGSAGVSPASKSGSAGVSPASKSGSAGVSPARNAHPPEFLVFEGRGFIDVPKEWRNRHGQITMYAPYSHRDFRGPTELLQYDKQSHGAGPYKLVVKREDVLTVHIHKHFPFEVVGWDGTVYPVAFNIHDYQPKTSTIHLPPTIHLTFAGNEFVVCSFVPRKVDYHDRDGAKAVPCPYGHASVHMDEILFYVAGNFTSRRGIDSGSISLHPAGIPHGPHPGTYEKSIGIDRTSELAVMCDTYKQLKLTTAAHAVEDKDYHLTWVSKEGGGADAPGAR